VWSAEGGREGGRLSGCLYVHAVVLPPSLPPSLPTYSNPHTAPAVGGRRTRPLLGLGGPPSLGEG